MEVKRAGHGYQLLLAIAWLCLLHVSCAVRCRSCEQGVRSQNQCLRVAECPSLDVCYTELYIENDGSQTFYSGCRSRQVCEKNNAFASTVVGRRDVPAHRKLSGHVKNAANGANFDRVRRDVKTGQNICTACCDTEFCNANQCNLNPVNQTSICYTCDNVANPNDCNQLTACWDNQRCFTEQRYAGGAKTFFHMGCQSKTICDFQELFLKTDGVIGRRSIDDSRVVCSSCCPYSYCNRLEDCSKRQRAPPLQTEQSSTSTGTTNVATTATYAATTDSETPTAAITSDSDPSTSTSTAVSSSASSTEPVTTQRQSTSSPLTTTDRTEGKWCYTCSGEMCGIIDDPPVKCNASAPYCFNSYHQEVGQQAKVTKSCTDKTTCLLKWYKGTSDKQDCLSLSGQGLHKVVCFYCCVEDYCNKKLVPDADTLYDINTNG